MLSVATPVMSNLMDDLARGIYKYLYESSTEFEGNHFVLVPVTDVVKNPRTRFRQQKSPCRPGVDENTCAGFWAQLPEPEFGEIPSARFWHLIATVRPMQYTNSNQCNDLPLL